MAIITIIKVVTNDNQPVAIVVVAQGRTAM